MKGTKRFFSALLSIVLTLSVLVSTGVFSAGALEEEKIEDNPSQTDGGSVIYFDYKSAGWDINDTNSVYCHIWKADGTGVWPAWKSKAEKCTYDEKTGLAKYDIETARKKGFAMDIDDTKSYCVIFCSTAGEQTYNLVMSGKCFGDTVYSTDDITIENPQDSEKYCLPAEWTNNTECGPQKIINSNGVVTGTCLADGTEDESLLALYLISYTFDDYKMSFVQDLITELCVCPDEVWSYVLEMQEDFFTSMMKDRDTVDKENEYIQTVLEDKYDPIHDPKEKAFSYSFSLDEPGAIIIEDYFGVDTELEIPAEIDGYRVVEIAENAFSCCRSKLTSVVIPEGVKRIGSNAFLDCAYLEKVTFPESIEYIGALAFEMTPWLDEKRFNNPLVIVNNIVIDGVGCEGDIIIPEYVTAISPCAFEQCYDLTGVDIRGKLDTIYEDTFRSCRELKYVRLPEGVTTIGEDAFDSCEALEEINFPESLLYIDDYAFDFCESLKSIKIPDSVYYIGNGAFWGCESLESCNFPESLVEVGSDAFLSTPWLEALAKENELVIAGSCLVSGMYAEGDVIIPEGVTLICGSAFESNNRITSVSIPSTVNRIGENAFDGCLLLNKVDIADGVRFIDDMAFFNCDELTSVEIPQSVIDIGDRAFGFVGYFSVDEYFTQLVEDFEIRGYKDTAAEQYVKDYEELGVIIKFVDLSAVGTMGDVDGNDKVDVNDVTLMQRYFADMAELTDTQVAVIDVNGDGKNDINDATELQRMLVA